MRFAKDDDPHYGKSFGKPHVLDWDDDGINDIVVQHGSDFWLQSKIKTEPNGGETGQWQFVPIDLGLETFGLNQHVYFKDFDGDGRIDLISADETPGGEIMIRLNQSTAGPAIFAEPTSCFRVSAEWRTNSVTVVDLDDDGVMEIACGVYRRTDNRPNKRWVVQSEIWLLDR